MDSSHVCIEQLTLSRRQFRIAVVTETYPPEVNGVAMTTGRFVDGLLRLGHQIQLIRPRQRGDDEPTQQENLRETLSRGVPIPRYNHLKMGLPARSALLAQWAEDRPDVVQIVTEGPLGWSALSAARRLRLPVVSEFHTNFDAYSTHYGLGWLKRPVTAYLRRFHNRSDLTLVPTRALQQALLGAGYRAVEVVARGVDTSLFNPARRSDSLRGSWGAGYDDLVITYVGRLAPEKNVNLVLQAYAAIRRERANARLLLVGDGPARAQIDSRKTDGVIFAGMRAGEDLACHYASADLFLFSSETETFGNVTAEALASGLPVVAFDYAAAAELVRHGENGLLAAPANRTEFVAQAVAAANPQTHARLRTAAATSVAHLDWAMVVVRLVERFEAAISRHRLPGHVQGRILVAPD